MQRDSLPQDPLRPCHEYRANLRKLCLVIGDVRYYISQFKQSVSDQAGQLAAEVLTLVDQHIRLLSTQIHQGVRYGTTYSMRDTDGLRLRAIVVDDRAGRMRL